MTSSPLFRALGAGLLASALVVVALPGCGGKPEPAKDGKKDEPKGDPKPEEKKGDSKPGDKVDPKPGPSVGTESKTLLGPVEKEAELAAEGFLKELGQGTAKAEALTPGFLKAVGKPLELPDDIAKGVSPGAAARWLKSVGEHYSFSPSLWRKQAGDAVYWRGQVNGRTLNPKDGGGYSLRLVKDGGAWKVDALVLTSLEIKGDLKGGSPDDAFQEFAAASFVEAMADAGAMEAKDRGAALARATVPALRAAWAPPFDGDKRQGYDYSPGTLPLKAIEFGGGTREYTLTKVGALPEFRVELTKPAGKKAVVVKLVKGTTPGEWLVSEVTEAKG